MSTHNICFVEKIRKLSAFFGEKDVLPEDIQNFLYDQI